MKCFGEDRTGRMPPFLSTRSGSRVAPRPTLCGKMVAPRKLLWPWIASTPYRSGIPSLLSSASLCTRWTMPAHASGLFGVGLPPPPLRTEPMPNCRTAPSRRLFTSTWAICPIFSRSVMRSMSRSVFRSATTGLADDERRRKLDPLGDRLPTNRRHHHRGRRASHLIEGLSHGRQRWVRHRGCGDVVEAHHSDVVRDAAATVPKRPHRSECHHVVGNE